MNKFLKNVKEFHEYFDMPVEDSIVDNNKSIREFRLNLIFEEMVELAHAMGCTERLEELCSNVEINHTDIYDKVETLDAFGDLFYVTSGSIISLGYTDVFEDAYDDIHESNMSKACNNIDEAKDTISYYKNERKEKLNMDIGEKNGKYIVRREDGKVMKNINYNEVQLKKYV